MKPDKATDFDLASLDLIDRHPKAVCVLHEKGERKLPVHQHLKGQLTYVEGGIAYVHLVDKTFVIPARHYIWIPKGQIHQLRIRHIATDVRSIYFYSHDDNKDPFYTKMGIYPVNRLLHEMIVYTASFATEAFPGSEEFQFLSSLKNMLPRISKIPLPFVVPTSQNERLRPIIDYISDHISQPLSLADVSKHFNMSERTVSRLFQAELSISFLQYLKQRRIIKGTELMLHTRANLTEIAYETGYQSLSAFSATFQQMMHMRPSEFMANI
ncbi:AraC family transcriptional regulator [Mucilaginibacter conchicola]|uniref:AraC family transcriptional regulator n=1 Tax=Mucilaginibacter conchicola TaxID=2303333 RepID=A0A372NQC7_9SPHI|nr:AraC family transcriptional regulator [Mucilaginibacter conchicola]RFZ90463.1 AraC family transcriptional regulator [Mucilaginibacter conchicola]